MISFQKHSNCPTSEELLDLQTRKMKADRRAALREHLCSCDFCGAEAEFYARWPQIGDEQVTAAEIPPPLYELADALLNNRHRDNSLLNRLLIENEDLTLRS